MGWMGAGGKEPRAKSSWPPEMWPLLQIPARCDSEARESGLGWSRGFQRFISETDQVLETPSSSGQDMCISFLFPQNLLSHSVAMRSLGQVPNEQMPWANPRITALLSPSVKGGGQHVPPTYRVGGGATGGSPSLSSRLESLSLLE
jgi:hypothetical protein